jgi:hypothetical protein
MEASIVRPRSTGWPDVWDPVALLRLFPSSSRAADVEAFDALVARLTLTLPHAAEGGTETKSGTDGGAGGQTFKAHKPYTLNPEP